MPLFFWLLDTAIINSYILAKLKGQVQSQVDFRKKLLWELVKMAKEEEVAAIPVQPPTKKMRMTKKSTVDDLPVSRLKVGNHFPLYNPQRRTCVWCSLKAKSGENGKGFDAPETHFSCKLCDVYLCLNSNRNCFECFHTLDTLDS